MCVGVQLCTALWNLMNCSSAGSSVHGVSQAKNTGVGCHFLLQGIFLTQESNLHFLHWRVNPWSLAPPGKSHSKNKSSPNCSLKFLGPAIVGNIVHHQSKPCQREYSKLLTFPLSFQKLPNLTTHQNCLSFLSYRFSSLIFTWIPGSRA